MFDPNILRCEAAFDAISELRMTVDECVEDRWAEKSRLLWRWIVYSVRTRELFEIVDQCEETIRSLMMHQVRSYSLTRQWLSSSQKPFLSMELFTCRSECQWAHPSEHSFWRRWNLAMLSLPLTGHRSSFPCTVEKSSQTTSGKVESHTTSPTLLRTSEENCVPIRPCILLERVRSRFMI